MSSVPPAKCPFKKRGSLQTPSPAGETPPQCPPPATATGTRRSRPARGGRDAARGGGSGFFFFWGGGDAALLLRGFLVGREALRRVPAPGGVAVALGGPVCPLPSAPRWRSGSGGGGGGRRGSAGGCGAGVEGPGGSAGAISGGTGRAAGTGWARWHFVTGTGERGSRGVPGAAPTRAWHTCVPGGWQMVAATQGDGGGTLG